MVNEWHKSPGPFIWAKSADEIKPADGTAARPGIPPPRQAHRRRQLTGLNASDLARRSGHQQIRMHIDVALDELAPVVANAIDLGAAMVRGPTSLLSLKQHGKKLL